MADPNTSEADFWRMKYFELQNHTAQVIQRLSAPHMAQQLAVAQQLATMLQARANPAQASSEGGSNVAETKQPAPAKTKAAPPSL